MLKCYVVSKWIGFYFWSSWKWGFFSKLFSISLIFSDSLRKLLMLGFRFMALQSWKNKFIKHFEMQYRLSNSRYIDTTTIKQISFLIMYKLLNLQILKLNGYHMILSDRWLFDCFAKIIFDYFFSLAFEAFPTYFKCSVQLYLNIYSPSCRLFEYLEKHFCFFYVLKTPLQQS